MIQTVTQFIESIQKDLDSWDVRTKPWFRGESGSAKPLQPKIAKFSAEQENHLLQSFRRRAGCMADTPNRSETDKWIFLAQHYGVPTRLLDWSEGALFALFFALNQRNESQRVYMLNPHVLNALALQREPDYLNFPITWSPSDANPKPGYENIALAWELRDLKKGYDLPLALEPTYQDKRMIAQRSAFTVHGKNLASIPDILASKNVEMSSCLYEYNIDQNATSNLLKQLSYLGISNASVFPDLDHLCKDIAAFTQNP